MFGPSTFNATSGASAGAVRAAPLKVGTVEATYSYYTVTPAPLIISMYLVNQERRVYCAAEEGGRIPGLPISPVPATKSRLACGFSGVQPAACGLLARVSTWLQQCWRCFSHLAHRDLYRDGDVISSAGCFNDDLHRVWVPHDLPQEIRIQCPRAPPGRLTITLCSAIRI